MENAPDDRGHDLSPPCKAFPAELQLKAIVTFLRNSSRDILSFWNASMSDFLARMTSFSRCEAEGIAAALPCLTVFPALGLAGPVSRPALRPLTTIVTVSSD